MAKNEAVGAAIRKAGSQAKLAREMGVSKSLVGRWYRGERSTAKWEPAIRDYTAGKSFTPPARTPKRVRQPVRRPRSGGGRHVSMRGRGARGQLFKREAQRMQTENVSGIVLTGTVFRSKRGSIEGGTWHGPLSITPEQFERVESGNATWDDVIAEGRPWADKIQIDGLDWDYLP